MFQNDLITIYPCEGGFKQPLSFPFPQLIAIMLYLIGKTEIASMGEVLNAKTP